MTETSRRFLVRLETCSVAKERQRDDIDRSAKACPQFNAVVGGVVRHIASRVRQVAGAYNRSSDPERDDADDCETRTRSQPDDRSGTVVV